MRVMDPVPAPEKGLKKGTGFFQIVENDQV